MAQRISQVGIWDFDVPSGELFWDKETCRISGVSPELKPSLENFFKIVHPDDLEFVKKSIQGALEDKPYDIELRIFRPDGTERVVHALGELSRDADGKPLKLFGTIQDITERKQAEEALRTSQKEYSSLFANMMLGASYCQIIFDESGKPIDFVYLQVNDTFEKITGMKREKIVGKKVTEAMPGIKEGYPELFEILAELDLQGNQKNLNSSLNH